MAHIYMNQIFYNEYPTEGVQSLTKSSFNEINRIFGIYPPPKPWLYIAVIIFTTTCFINIYILKLLNHMTSYLNN